LARFDLVPGLSDYLMENSPLLVVQIIAAIVNYEIQHRPVAEVGGLVEDDATVANYRSRVAHRSDSRENGVCLRRETPSLRLTFSGWPAPRDRIPMGEDSLDPPRSRKPARASTVPSGSLDGRSSPGTS
jgi:hypothetical protein